MKTKLLFLLAFLCSTTVFTQSNDGWSQYAKPLYVNQMVKDASGNYHYATNLGYQKLDGNFNTVDFINLTSHDTPLGNCFSVAVNPSNENQIALAENNRLFVYTNGIETNAIEVVSATPFTGPSLYYNGNNALYIFDKYANIEGYSVFENGILNDVVTTGIRPQDIIENNGGTKIFIAGTNNGLWEYTKATDTWVNYTMTNSNLNSNFINDLYVDDNDDLYAGTYQGINKIEPDGTITVCEPSTFYPVFELDIHPTTGDILARTSDPNSSNTFGFCIVDFDTCSWVNYTDTNSSLNVNMFETAQFAVAPEDGKIVASEAILSAENTFVFDPNNPQEPLLGKPIEFIVNGVPVRVDVNYTVDLDVRKKTDGTLDIGFTNGNGFDKFHHFPINPLTFNGAFPAATPVNLPIGKPAYSIINDNDYFIIENNEGWVFVDDNDTTTEFNHNIPNFLAIVTKKAAKFNSDDGTVNLIHKGFDASFNYRVYKTTCNTITGTCGASEEIFTNDRDLTENIVFGASEDKTTGNVAVVAVKTNSSGNITRTAIHAEPNMPAVDNWDRIHNVFPEFDPTIFSFVLDDLTSMFVPDLDTYKIIHEDNDNNSIAEEDFDIGDYSPGDVVLVASPDHTIEITDDQASDIAVAIVMLVSYRGLGPNLVYELRQVDPSINEGSRKNLTTELTDAKFYDLPTDTFVKELNLVQYNNTEAMIVLLTNYGILLKTGIDISNLSLNTQDYTIDNEVKLYPNPTNDLVSISDKNIISVEVFDINGKSVLETKSSTLSVRHLANGIYIIKAKTQDGSEAVRKLIKN
ncbi:hypothetical protein FBALC1_17047 [Flavobacteriales bacterium ALC-1]|nr:hypothetical protein FBALC1_17047 [Flavobacteriales bacterium ALC-1]